MEEKTLREAQRLKLKLEDDTSVTTLDQLKVYFATAHGEQPISYMYSCGIGTWEIGSMGWKKDFTERLLDAMGWEYDPSTVDKGKNCLGNGIVLKVVSRMRSNLRRKLRACSMGGKSGYDLTVKRAKEKCFKADGKRLRRKAGFAHIDLTELVETKGSDDHDHEKQKVSCAKAPSKCVLISNFLFVVLYFRKTQ